MIVDKPMWLDGDIAAIDGAEFRMSTLATT
jgi:hypothetical protein